MKHVLWIGVVITLVLLGVGIYSCGYHGCASFINEVQNSPVDGGVLAWAIMRIVLAVVCVMGAVICFTFTISLWASK
jgi:hypothetical protein